MLWISSNCIPDSRIHMTHKCHCSRILVLISFHRSQKYKHYCLQAVPPISKLLCIGMTKSPRPPNVNLAIWARLPLASCTPHWQKLHTNVPSGMPRWRQPGVDHYLSLIPVVPGTSSYAAAVAGRNLLGGFHRYLWGTYRHRVML